jgi:hypothetical protein
MLRSIRRPVLACAAVAALTAAACDSGDTPTNPSDPGTTPSTVTETFSGSVTVNGSLSFTFITGGSGAVTATLTAVTPDEASVLGLSLGVWTGSTCQVVVANDNASKGVPVSGNVSQGNATLCARVADVGKLTAPAGFEITVVHP